VGALTVGVVTKPFHFEGRKRMKHAEGGMNCLRENVDSLITIPNQRLLAISGSTLSMVDAFKRADEVLLNAVQGISDLINHTGLINSDFADVKTIMQNKGLALMGIGYGEGDHRAVEAATNAISSPLLEDVSIDGATGIIINITGGSNLKIHEVNEATTLIMEAAHEDAEIIFGTVIDESMKDRVKVTVIATGLGGVQHVQQALQSIADGAQQAPQQPQMSDDRIALAPLTLNSAQTTLPPQPNAAMLANAAAIVKGQASVGELSMNDDDAREAPPLAEPQKLAGLASMVTTPAAEGGELARARAIAQRLGITNLTDDEYDVPTYMRRQQEREI
jgi:cell division protein FtsZ